MAETHAAPQEPGGRNARRKHGARQAHLLRPALAWAALIVVLAWGLGAYPLLDPDEGRNGEVAREMMAGGDYALPHLDGLPYLDKPVLFFALDALSQQVFGVNEAAARLPSLLAALATAALTAWFAGRLFGRRARAIAALGALVAPLPLAFARTVIFDSLLAFCITLALCAFYLAVEARAAARGLPAGDSALAAGDRALAAGYRDLAAGDSSLAAESGQVPAAGRGRPGYLGWTLLAWAAIGLGILAKGPVALAVPLLAAAPFGFIRRAARAVWHPAGVAAMALVVGPWIGLVSRQVPEFLHYALFTETWARVTTTQMNREGPIWLYIPCLIAGTLPWSVLVLAGWRRSLRPRRGPDRRWDPALLYMILWIAVPFVLFSLSHSKRPQYILPLLPAVALLAAKVWVDAEGAAAGRTAAGKAMGASASAPGGPEGAAPAAVAPAAGGTAWPTAAAPVPAAGAAFLPSTTLAEPAAGGVPASPSAIGEPPTGYAGQGAATTGTPAIRTATTGAPPADTALPGAAATAWTWLALAALCGAAAIYGAATHPPAMARATRLPATLAAVAVAFAAGAALIAWSRRARLPGTTAAAAGPAPAAGLAWPARRRLLLVGLLLPIAVMPALALPLLDQVAGRRSARDGAAAILAAAPRGAEVVGVRAFPPSLPFYLRHTVLVASPRGRELTSNYVLAYLQKWMTADPSRTPLRPFAWWTTALATCDTPRIFVTWADDPAPRATLTAAGLPQLFANDRMAAYGPCTPPAPAISPVTASPRVTATPPASAAPLTPPAQRQDTIPRRGSQNGEDARRRPRD